MKNFIISDKIITEWQEILNLIVSISGVKAGLIMHINGDYLEVLTKNTNKTSPYLIGEKNHLKDSGLYCETVIKKQEMLLVDNALKSDKWNHNPDLQYNMIAYLGFPIRDSDGTPFGTICILDNKENHFPPNIIKLMEKMRDLLEKNLIIENKFINMKHLADNSLMHKVIDNIPTSICLSLLSPKYRILYVNQHFKQTFGEFTSDIMSLSDWFSKNNSDDAEQTNYYIWKKVVHEAVSNPGTPTNPCEMNLVSPDFSLRRTLIIAVVLDKILLTSLIDLSKITYLQNDFSISETNNELLYDNSLDVIWTLNKNSNLTYVSPTVRNITGYTVDECLKSSIKNMFAESSWEIIQKILTEIYSNINANKSAHVYRQEVQVKRKDNSLFWGELTMNSVYDSNGEFIELVGVTRDISMRRKFENQLIHLATHDILTDLPNARLSSERLSTALSMSKRYNRLVAVMFMDLNLFKKINDNYGHSAGNAALKHFAAVLRSSICETDTAARIGGDEFLVVAVNLQTRNSAEKIAEKILKTISEPFIIDGHYLKLSASIGITLYPSDGKNVEQLINLADSAMYEAKKQGHNKYKFADEIHKQRQSLLSI
ncbi:diguanylate cyclase domain-containing protein [Pectinatus frisingensis]|uniref:sensor domain-containing diguanylate cyclase n=1 Tax=Pectinatus frisingensis TaxID=865 RepID=UPI0018C5321E|nr:diguanylate cyclase [Pectinatus frisingensis]